MVTAGMRNASGVSALIRASSPDRTSVRSAAVPASSMTSSHSMMSIRFSLTWMPIAHRNDSFLARYGRSGAGRP